MLLYYLYTKIPWGNGWVLLYIIGCIDTVWWYGYKLSSIPIHTKCAHVSKHHTQYTNTEPSEYLFICTYVCVCMDVPHIWMSWDIHLPPFCHKLCSSVLSQLVKSVILKLWRDTPHIHSLQFATQSRRWQWKCKTDTLQPKCTLYHKHTLTIQEQRHIYEWCCHGNVDSNTLPITPASYCSIHHPRLCMTSPSCMLPLLG